MDCSPIVRAEKMELARLIDIDGRGRQGIVGFEQTILWIREIGAQVHLIHGNRIVDDRTSFCDVGSWGSCLTAATESAMEECEQFSVDRSSTMSAVVMASATEIPVLPPAEHRTKRGIFGRFQYEAVPSDWLRDDRPRIEACLKALTDRTCQWPENGLPTLWRTKVAENIQVWSSALDHEANEAALTAFRLAWMTIQT